LVTPGKVALYLEMRVMNRKRYKVFTQSKPYEGIIGMTQSDPQTDMEAYGQEVQEIRNRFIQGMMPTVLHFVRVLYIDPLF
jgi:hypothetical protein